MTKLLVAFRNYANAPKSHSLWGTRGNIMTVERNPTSNWARKIFRSSGGFTLTTFKVVNVNTPEVANNTDSF